MYIMHDNLRGDIESITDTCGSIVAQYHYDPWGNQILYSGSLAQPFRYAGYYFDDETGLYYLKSRYYSPALGRFLTRDSYNYIKYTNPQTLNLYSYVCNDPVNLTDPNGNWMPGDEHIKFTDKEKSEIEYYGNMYNASSTAADRKHWHDLANNVRTEAMMNEAQSWVLGIAGGGAEGAARTLEELGDKGLKEVCASPHAIEQILGRDAGRGVSTDAIIDALRNPLKTIPQEARNTIKQIGKDVTVVYNKYGKLVTAWARNHFGWR